jgi:hypothetical protein
MEENLKTMKSEALDLQNNLEQELLRHTAAQNELNHLYSSIFQGPTPSFPEEDDTERQAILAAKTYNNTYAKLEADHQALRNLEDANKRVKSSLMHIETALDSSRLDMWGIDSADLMERTALHNAELELIQAQMLVMQAQRFSSEVKNLPPVNMASGSLMSDVLFDNIFTDLEFHETIKQSRTEAERCQQALLAQLGAAKERYQASEAEAIAQSRLLDNARQELQKVRQRIFERLANGEAPQAPQAPQGQQSDERGAPPPYEFPAQ